MFSGRRARFWSHEKLYKQISCFNPNGFSKILASPQNVELGLIATIVPEIDKVALQNELISFASTYKDLKKGLQENMNKNENDSDRLGQRRNIQKLLNYLGRQHVRIVSYVLSSCYQSIGWVHMKIYMQHINLL